YAVSERNALEAAIEFVIPGMIDAGEIGDVVPSLQANQRAFVRAAVDHGMDASLHVARDDDRCLADAGCLAVARVGDFHLEPEETPASPAKDALLLELVDFVIGEQPVRRAGHALRRPLELLRAKVDWRDARHWLLSGALSRRACATSRKEPTKPTSRR